MASQSNDLQEMREKERKSLKIRKDKSVRKLIVYFANKRFYFSLRKQKENWSKMSREFSHANIARQSFRFHAWMISVDREQISSCQSPVASRVHHSWSRRRMSSTEMRKSNAHTNAWLAKKNTRNQMFSVCIFQSATKWLSRNVKTQMTTMIMPKKINNTTSTEWWRWWQRTAGNGNSDGIHEPFVSSRLFLASILYFAFDARNERRNCVSVCVKLTQTHGRQDKHNITQFGRKWMVRSVLSTANARVSFGSLIFFFFSSFLIVFCFRFVWFWTRVFITSSFSRAPAHPRLMFILCHMRPCVCECFCV